MSENAIIVDHVSKLYKLYDKPSDRFKEAMGLTKKKLYREHYALKDISFSVKKGETVGIIGTNGSGKSTMLKIITGVLNPTSGNIGVNGRISALLELGAGFNGEYSGIENVYLNGTMNGFTREEIDARMDDILRFADIGEFVKQPVKTYSSGMFVRLAFAVAINIEPEILIVDEALSVGDVFFQAKCYRKFEEFREMGKTLLMVSHDLGSISKYSDRVILLNQGTKVDEGNPKEIVDLYKRFLVHQEEPIPENEEELEEQQPSGDSEEKVTAQSQQADTKWKQHDGFTVNPNVLEYGEKRAEIVDFAVIDENGLCTNTIEKGSEFTIKMKVHFKETVSEPIFAYTIKDPRGTEITGTNTMYEECDIQPKDNGDEVTVSFRQKMNLQGGEYLISFGCTGYREGDFHVYHRLYDACSLTVVSTKNTVGFYDMESQVTVEER